MLSCVQPSSPGTRLIVRAMEDGHQPTAEVAALVASARLGEQEAWESLYRAIYPRLHTYLGRHVGFENADDAVNETMARAVAGISRFKLGRAGFDGWVFGIARRVAAEHYRVTARRQRESEAGYLLVGLTAPEHQPEDVLVLSDDHDRLRAAFARLSQREREVLELRVVAQLSIDDVAAAMAKRPGAVRTAQSRALAHLRDLLTEDGHQR